MVGSKIRRKRDKAVFTVSGTHGAQVVLAPVEFGASVTASAIEVRELFEPVGGGELAPLPDVDIQRGWDRLAKRFNQQAAATDPAPAALAPEESLAATELTAQEIVASPRHLWAFFGQRLAVTGEVAAAARKLVAAMPAEDIAADAVLRWAWSEGQLDLTPKKSAAVGELVAARAKKKA